jgi:hypothetical protein
MPYMRYQSMEKGVRMAQITLSEDVFDRAVAFKPLVESVLEISLETDAYIELLVRLAPDYLMNEFFGGADSKALLGLLQQLGQADAKVYGVIAQVLEQDEVKAMEAQKRLELKQSLGFREPEGQAG